MPRPGRPKDAGTTGTALVNFYASDELRGVDRARRCAETGKSKTQVIVEALEEHRRRRQRSHKPG